jgi:hypothetical protein
MIITNRLFERVSPNRSAKSIYIFCEGRSREFDYFSYFIELDSRINIEIYKLAPHENNSPLGLLDIAEECILKSKKNPNPKYNFIDGDEVWIVLDVDKDKSESREPQITKVQKRCDTLNRWQLSISNPCFEVWLYYHQESSIPTLDDPEIPSNWKRLVNNVIAGGFDSRKHPIYIEKASKNAKNNYKSNNNRPDVGCTNAFTLADSILSLLREKIQSTLAEIEK